MAITRAQQVKQMLQDGGRIGFRIGSDSGKDTSGRDYGSSTAAAASVASSPSRNTGGGDNNQQTVTAPVKIPKPVKDAINLGGDISYLKNLIELNPVGIMKNIIMDKIFEDQTSLDTEDENMKMAELSQKQLDFLNSPKIQRDLKEFGREPKAVFDMLPDYEERRPTLFNPLKKQEPTTPEEFNEYLDSINVPRMQAAEGGIMDLETGRQMYFLGKLVKKATRAVKKVAKSPIGKAALLYAGTAGLGSLGAGGGLSSLFKLNTFAPATVKANLGTSFARLMGGKLMADPTGLFAEGQLPGKQNIFQKALGLVKDNPFEAITAASAVAGALTEEQEDQAQQLADNTGIDIEEARNAILQAAKENYAMDSRARGFKADGGIMRAGYQEGSKEPVAKKTMPLLDMGGKEMDLREDGGFVPIGRMEKADDVPARLSKNEFVFTADAVRNAGDGNVDKGAEVMYNMMKNLESGGDVSEESQGLEGAREMFQTSQRLEEVI
jgi:hypothetical protein